MRPSLFAFWFRILWSGRLQRLSVIVRSAEHRHGVTLTPGALSVLAGMIEDARGKDRRDPEPWEAVDWLVAVMAAHPDPRDEIRSPRERSSLSLLRAIRLKWCNIPPFCRPVRDEELMDDRGDNRR